MVNRINIILGVILPFIMCSVLSCSASNNLDVENDSKKLFNIYVKDFKKLKIKEAGPEIYTVIIEKRDLVDPSNFEKSITSKSLKLGDKKFIRSNSGQFIYKKNDELIYLLFKKKENESSWIALIIYNDPV